MQDHGTEHSSVAYEKTDISVPPLVRITIICVIIVIITGAACFGLMRFLIQYEMGKGGQPGPLGMSAYVERQPPLPRLQRAPFDDIITLRDAEKKILDSSEWVDKPTGVVRIKIDDAMRIIVERGLPSRLVPVEVGKAPAVSTEGVGVPVGTPEPPSHAPSSHAGHAPESHK